MPASDKETLQPPQQQKPPGVESKMQPKPKADDAQYQGSGKLQDKVALITGGDSGIGRAVAMSDDKPLRVYAYAKEGANVAIIYLNEHDDAKETKNLVEQQGRRALAIAGDITEEAFCQQAVQQTVDEFGKLDILINNAAEQHPQQSIRLVHKR